ncbi:hypothetical protein TBLA_0C01140 [Henningerozyma blattae CBS 6284]|uniref:Uncharacterized protein n=1 Tax=Henningerozyma blattae (strain ATCC 34711 / CBS 6284 / DSM 70876 / NBRC 10599 / NRRL Y-10934 / UCD 77-7) TaxID=1071380 RepID=I2H0M7_HENB6|nr:hypothetical protein TBLA_0C01140 [Tetrapisispora blattae CBS 6284]CCH59929.1 hypothetical protein TBLA_0C01140 [Tetrapisispora blattae CBS 6284]
MSVKSLTSSIYPAAYFDFVEHELNELGISYFIDEEGIYHKFLSTDPNNSSIRKDAETNNSESWEAQQSEKESKQVSLIPVSILLIEFAIVTFLTGALLGAKTTPLKSSPYEVLDSILYTGLGIMGVNVIILLCCCPYYLHPKRKLKKTPVMFLHEKENCKYCNDSNPWGLAKSCLIFGTSSVIVVLILISFYFVNESIGKHKGSKWEEYINEGLTVYSGLGTFTILGYIYMFSQVLITHVNYYKDQQIREIPNILEC